LEALASMKRGKGETAYKFECPRCGKVSFFESVGGRVKCQGCGAEFEVEGAS